MARPKSGDPRVTVCQRIPERTRDVIEAWGKEHGLSLSDAMRQVLQAGYDALGLSPKHNAIAPLPVMKHRKGI